MSDVAPELVVVASASSPLLALIEEAMYAEAPIWSNVPEVAEEIVRLVEAHYAAGGHQ